MYCLILEFNKFDVASSFIGGNIYDAHIGFDPTIIK